MSKMRRSILNKRDNAWFRKIVAVWDLDKNLNEVLEFIANLENHYPLTNIDPMDYMHSGWEVDAPEPLFYGRKGYHIFAGKPA